MLCVDFADESWREAREGAGVCSATALRRALPAALAEIVQIHSKILAGKVFGARLTTPLGTFQQHDALRGDRLFSSYRSDALASFCFYADKFHVETKDFGDALS